MKKFPILFLIIFLGGLFLPLVSLAQGLVPCGTERDPITGEITNPCQFCHLFVMFKAIIDFVLVYLVFPAATLLIVVGGIMFFLYAENPQKVEQAKSLLTAAVIGLIVIFASWMVIGLFFTAIGLSDFALSFTGPGNWFEIDCQ